jgi:hypothetical protein
VGFYNFGVDKSNGVSCVSANRCVAVSGAAAELWNGTTWTVMSVPTPPDAQEYETYLRGVACVPATNPGGMTCEAVGRYSSTHPAFEGATVGLIEHFDGTTWTVAPTSFPSQPGDPSSTSELFAVSCVSSTSCRAVGGAMVFIAGAPAGGAIFTHTDIQRWDGSNWTAETVPGGDSSYSEPVLHGVSCVSATDCEAVGVYYHHSPTGGSPVESSAAERLVGTTWSMVTAASAVTSVACPASNACVSVGFGAARWNGSSWSDAKPAKAPNGATAVLVDVSCTSVTSCDAVGFYYLGSGADTATIAEHWNGSSWTVVATPRPTTRSTLGAVSCPVAAACLALGGTNTTPYRMALRFS